MGVIGLPRLGIYSPVFKGFFESLGCQVVQPSKVSQEIIKLGVMNSSDMICFPYKVTLGQEIWCLEHGATDLIMFSTHGRCRFKHYHQLQEQTLRNLGYQFKMRTFSGKNFLPELIRITGASPTNLIKAMLRVLSQVGEVEHKAYDGTRQHPLRIGIVGEIYTILEDSINFDIVRKLQKIGVHVDVSIKLSDFIRKEFKLDYFRKRAEKKEARQLLREPIGGHGFCSIYNTAWYGKHGFDGVIHLLPLSCMPESTIECLTDQLAEKYNIPIYRFPIDENNFEAGFNTRLETFVSMLKRKKRNEAHPGN